MPYVINPLHHVFNSTTHTIINPVFYSLNSIHTETKQNTPRRLLDQFVLNNDGIHIGRPMDWRALANTWPVRFHRTQLTPVYLLSNMHTENKFIKIKHFLFLFMRKD